MSRLRFIKTKHPDFGMGYEIFNSKDENIGCIHKIRTGTYMHWNHIVEKRHIGNADYISWSSGCQDEIRAQCKKCYSLEKNGEL